MGSADARTSWTKPHPKPARRELKRSNSHDDVSTIRAANRIRFDAVPPLDPAATLWRRAVRRENACGYHKTTLLRVFGALLVHAFARILVCVLALTESSAVRATERVLDAELHHIRCGDQREWSEF